MAAFARIARILKPSQGIHLTQIHNFSSTSTRELSKTQKRWFASMGLLAGGAGALLFALDRSVEASGSDAHSAQQEWAHNGLIKSYDHASIRRGYEVYKQVCAACHSMKYIAYRNLIGVSHTEAEAKAEAEEQQFRDGPNEAGEFFMRPGKLSDYFPDPYANEESARAANNGAYPPDLSLIVSARKGGEDYIFALLTGYMDAPAGVIIREGQYYNPYFAGGAISMAQALYNEVIEYADGTPATASQMAKDVGAFLRWASEPEYDDRKKMSIKALGISLILLGLSLYVKKHKWSSLKSRKIVFYPKKK